MKHPKSNAPVFVILFQLAFQFGYAQDLLISFQPEPGQNQIDSIRVTNLTSGQRLTISGRDTLQLVQPSGIEGFGKTAEDFTIFPNPCSGNATACFTTNRSNEAELRLFSQTGQLIDRKILDLNPGTHLFNLRLPRAGIYFVSMSSGPGYSIRKIMCTGEEGQISGIIYAGIGVNGNNDLPVIPIKSITTVKTMDYSDGDNLEYSVHSGEDNTIVADSPKSSKTYALVFYGCVDADHNSYPVVQIGNLTWMAKNLYTSRYADKEAIPYIRNNDDWNKIGSGAYCYYNNDSVKYKYSLGALYNWFAVSTGKLCPQGWRVATTADWEHLAAYISQTKGPYNKFENSDDWYTVGKHLKAHTGWASNLNGVNDVGFTGLPGGERNKSGIFQTIGTTGIWWTSSEESATKGWYSWLYAYHNNFFKYKDDKEHGYSVRCVKTY